MAWESWGRSGMGSWTKSLSLGLKRKGSSRATFVEKGREMKMRSSEERINRSRRFFCCVDFQFSSFLPAAKFTFHKLGCERGERGSRLATGRRKRRTGRWFDLGDVDRIRELKVIKRISRITGLGRISPGVLIVGLCFEWTVFSLYSNDGASSNR